MRDTLDDAVLFLAGKPDSIVQKAELSDRIANGDVVIARGGNALGAIMAMTRDEIYRQVTDLCGEELCSKLKPAGLTRIHNFLSVKQVEDIHERATTNLRSVYMQKTEELIRDLTGHAHFYVNHNFVLRFYMPNEIMQKNFASLKKRPGKLIQHGPHMDLWQNVALNAINIWIAIEDVEEGNGMVVYKDAFGKPVPRGGEHLRDDQVPGKPMRLPCKAGDMILFQSQHLHGGVLNRTDQTRVAITTRFTLEAPLHPRLGTQLHYASASAIRSGKGKRIQLSYMMDKLRPRNLALRLESKFGKGRPGEEEAKLEIFNRLLEQNWFAETQDRSLEKGGVSSDRIAVVNERHIAINKDNGETVTFQRRCPHMGADLACGYVEDNHLWCPWHDQGFSLEDGAPAGSCSGLPPLRQSADQAGTQTDLGPEA